MLKIIYACNPKDPMSSICENRITNDLIKNKEYQFIDTNSYPFAIDDLDLQFNQTVIISNDGQELSRLEGPFDTELLRKSIENAEKFLKGEFSL